MCGIVGYVGRQPAAPILIEGLTRLEYRGYDSAGIAVLGTAGATVVRRVGRVRELEAALPKRLSGTVGIGHTRWATHGPATEANAHPHSSEDGRISVVHNGIIDNAGALRSRLGAEGVTFSSDTDTEVLAHLVARSGAATLEDRVVEALEQVVGTYAVAVLDAEQPDRVVVARNGSPLIIGVGDREMFVASDVSALVRHTSSVVHLDDGELAVVTAKDYRTFTRDSHDTGRVPTEIEVSADDVEIGAHGHFMAKEIAEQPETVARMLRGRLDTRFGTARLDGLNLTPRELRAFRRVKILGCGSAYYVGELGALMIEELARIPAHAEAASEFRYRNPIIEPDTLYVAVSQSGETADTAFAVREIQRKGGQVIGLVNVVGSTIARECDGGIYLHAGPEIAVASTKALTHMGVGFALLALLLGRVRDLSVADGQRVIAGLERLPADIAAVLADEERIAVLAEELSSRREPLLHRTGARLPRGTRRRPEVQGDLLPARRGLPDERAEARPAGAHRGVPAHGRSDPRRRADRPQPRRGGAGAGARRTGHRDLAPRCRPRAPRRATRRRAAQRDRARPHPADDPDAAARVSRSGRARTRHRQAS